MKLALDANPKVNLFRSYSSGEVRVGEQLLRKNCIVTADAVLVDWTLASDVAALSLADLETIFKLEPDVVLLGTGDRQQFPRAELRGAFASRRIALEPMDLGAACRTFNILVQEDRRVLAALLLNGA